MFDLVGKRIIICSGTKWILQKWLGDGCNQVIWQTTSMKKFHGVSIFDLFCVGENEVGLLFFD